MELLSPVQLPCSASSGKAAEAIGKLGESTMCQWKVFSLAAYLTR